LSFKAGWNTEKTHPVYNDIVSPNVWSLTERLSVVVKVV